MKPKLVFLVVGLFVLPVAGTALAELASPTTGVNGAGRVDRAAQPDGVPVEQMTVIQQVIDALHARDAEAFIGVFAPGGAFNPRGDFEESSSPFPSMQPVADAPLVHAWMGIIDAWGLEALIIACNPLDGPGYLADDSDLVQCEVATRWRTLSMEITEGWGFEFRGTQLLWWNSSVGTNINTGQFQFIDLEPHEGPLPGFPALLAWEAWLAANYPEEADRYLNPRPGPPGLDDCDWCADWEAGLAPGDPDRAAMLAPLMWPAENDWEINGHRFTPAGLIPYDPAFAEQIEASIQKFMDEPPAFTTTPQSTVDVGGNVRVGTEGGPVTCQDAFPGAVQGALVTILDASSDLVIGTGVVTSTDPQRGEDGWTCEYNITATVSSTPDWITVQIANDLTFYHVRLSNGGFSAIVENTDTTGTGTAPPETTAPPLGESTTSPVPVDSSPPDVTPPPPEPPPPSEPPPPPPRRNRHPPTSTPLTRRD